MNTTYPERKINYYGSDWAAIKEWLLEAKERKIGLLIQADTNDKTNQVRGALSIIQEILALEDAAARAKGR